MNDSELNQLILQARQLTRRRFGKVIQLYAPLYLSNECVDTCTYCGFSLANRIPRKTLSPSEVREEAQALIDQGIQHLLLVSGEHPVHVSTDYLAEVIRLLRPHFASLSIEVAPLKKEEYRKLIDAGLDGVVLYQEAYDRERYEAVHLAGPKKSYDKRLLAPEEAAEAGIRFLGMGILLGLADWPQEIEALVRHVRKLRQKHWQTEFTISLPRLRDCASDFDVPFPVSNHDFIEMIARLRIALPEVGIVLSTRESPALRDFLIGMGVTQMSAGSKTEPGGYLHPEENLKQFEIEDARTVKEISTMIESKGYEPIYKDWEPHYENKMDR